MVDRKLILAVAGSGKTRYIIEKLNLEQRFFIITYTLSNRENLRTRIIQKFGYFPSNITLQSYYTFLYSFCFRPILGNQFKSKGINWLPNPNMYSKGKDRFIDQYDRVYSNRISKILKDDSCCESIAERIEKYYDHFYIDEAQDIAGHDFNLLVNLNFKKVDYILVGDFFQHTFDTGRDGKINSTLHDNYEKYIARFKEAGFIVDTDTLQKSFRCSPSICNFITEALNINIVSCRDAVSQIELIEDKTRCDEVFNDTKIVKLYYKERYRYSGNSKNWGECKGEDKYVDVCVVLNKTTYIAFKKKNLQNLAPSTKNKFYVACTRAKGNLFFINEEQFRNYKNT